MLSLLKQSGLALLTAGAVALLSLVPAAAQSGYPGSSPHYGMAGAPYGYGAPRSQPQPRYAYGSASGSGYGYGTNAYSNAYAGRYYTVMREDSLLKIAARFGVSLQALLNANPSIRNPNLIFAGQRLAIPAYSAGTYGSTGGYKAPAYTAPYGSSRTYQTPGNGYAAPGKSSGAYQAPGAPSSGANVYSAATPSAGSPTPQATPAPASTPGAMAQTVTLDLAAHNMAFDKSTLAVPAGAHVIVHFNNMDAMPHNLAVYTDAGAQQAIFQGQIVNGPNSTTYEFDAPAQPGTYFFRCDVHPTIMTGQFIVQ